MVKATCAIITHNAASTILEWLAWHALQGFTHFIVVDAHSSDNTVALAQSCRPHVAVDVFAPTDLPQTPQERRAALITVAQEATPEDHWLLILDQDEFLDLHEPLDHFLTRHADHHALGIHWKVFGKPSAAPDAALSICSYRHCANPDFPDHHGGRVFAHPAHHNLTSPAFWEGNLGQVSTPSPQPKLPEPVILHYPWMYDQTMPPQLAEYYDVEDLEDLHPQRYALALKDTMERLVPPPYIPQADDHVEFDHFSMHRVRPSEQEYHLLKG